MRKKKNGLSFLFFALLNLGIVVYIAYREFRTGARGVAIFNHLRVRPVYLILAVACFAVAVCMETLKYRAMMRVAGGRDDPRGAYECAVLGKYYDNITPLGAGGQPFQIVYLKKRRYSTGVSAALPIAGFLALQLAFALIAIVVFIFNGKVVRDLPAIRISANVGLVFYLFVPLCIVLFALIPRTFGKMVAWVVRALVKLHIVKDPHKAAASIFQSLSDYSESLNILRKSPNLFLTLMLESVVYQAAILSVPFFVLYAFSARNGWWTVFSLVTYIYAAITIIPTPGNSGAAEGSFYAVFSMLSGNYLFWAMLVWRLLVYYGWLILGLLVMARSAVVSRRPQKRPVPDGPLRVALFSDLFYPAIDGVVRTVDSYAKRLNRGEGRCCVVCPRGAEPFDDSVLPYPVLRTPAVRMPGIAYLMPVPLFSRRLKKELRAGQYDVFHAHSPFLVGRFAVKMGRRLGVPVVGTFHSKYYDDALNITHSKFLANVMLHIVVSFYRQVDEVWACSRSTAETLRSYGFQGEIRVMENGVNAVSIADPDGLRRRARAEFSLPEDRHILLFVGQQIWQKNLRLVLDVTKRLQPDGDYLTVVVGGGYDSKAICAYAESLALGDSVRFTGLVTDRQLLCGLYLCSDIFFFPSIYDNAPLVLREAALLGLPALLVEGSNSAEVVRDGINGYTAENDADKMAEKLRAIFSRGNRALVGETASRTIPVSWDEIVLRAESRYRRLGREPEPAVSSAAE